MNIFIKPVNIQRCILVIYFVYFYLQKEKMSLLLQAKFKKNPKLEG